jgi:hypothetical protein
MHALHSVAGVVVDVRAGIKAGTLFNYKTGGNAVILNRR